MYAVRINPYCTHMGNTLAARVAEIQKAEAHNIEHWASVRNELELMRMQLIDLLALYNAAIEIPCDNSIQQIESKLRAINSTGSALREMLHEVQRYSEAALSIENQIQGKHDPSVTYRMMQEFTAIVGKKLREYELIGALGPEGNSQAVIDDLTNAVRKNMQMPFSGLGMPHSGAFVNAEEEIVMNPAMAAQAMDASVPHASTQPQQEQQPQQEAQIA
jgi:hypothetical protein